MDINKPITNPKLLEIIREMKQGAQKEEFFWEEIYKSNFLCPINIKEGNQKNVLNKETYLNLVSIKDEKNNNFLIAFTDWQELRKWQKNKNQKALILTYEKFQEIISKNKNLYQGLVINPFSDNLVLNRKLVVDSQKKIQKISNGTTIMLGIPKEIPEGMINALNSYFIKEKNVNKAYLLWMVEADDSGFLLVLDVNISKPQLFDAIGKICNPFLKKQQLNMVFANSNLGQLAIKEDAPFYER